MPQYFTRLQAVHNFNVMSSAAAALPQDAQHIIVVSAASASSFALICNQYS
jgi:hypothetical protein